MMVFVVVERMWEQLFEIKDGEKIGVFIV